MIDVTNKRETIRIAIACGSVNLSPSTIKMIKENKIPKGDVLSIARTSAILGAKKVSELIPLCHPIRITGIDINFSFIEYTVRIEAKVSAVDRTGVEMEALTAVAIAGLTIYDMCKQVDKNITISDIHLVEKRGGNTDRNYEK